MMFLWQLFFLIDKWCTLAGLRDKLHGETPVNTAEMAVILNYGSFGQRNFHLLRH